MSDRERILLRRARFVTAALSGLTACSKPSELPHADPSSKPLPPPSATASASAQPEADLPPDLPDLTTPPSITSEIAKQELERLRAQVKQLHEHIARAANAIPSCPIADEACKQTFREVADQLVLAEDTMHHLGPRCGGKSADAKVVEERVDKHRAYARARLDGVKARVVKMLDAQGPGAKKTWEDVLQASAEAHPEPCLKYACPDW